MKQINYLTIILFFLFSCKKDGQQSANNNNTKSGGQNRVNTIAVTTVDVVDIKTILATANAKVELDATKDTITKKGIVWSTSPSPINTLPTKIEQGDAKGSYSGQLAGLQSNTKYYVRAYAVNKRDSIIYGNELSFTTKVSWKTVSACGLSMVGIREDGTLWACGENDYGQLGDGSNALRTLPIQIGTDKDWKDVSLGGVWDDVRQRSAIYVLALKNDGSLWAWGSNMHGQLGLGTTTNVFTPTRIGTSIDWKQVAAGSISYGLKNDGSVWRWGNRDQNLNSINYVKAPAIYSGVDQIASLAPSNSFQMLGIRTNGSLWSWYADTALPGINGPVQLTTAVNWRSALCGGDAYFGVKTDGSLSAWGLNTGVFGNGTTSGQTAPVTNINTISAVKMLATNGSSALALKTDGTLWATGWGNEGQLGNGSSGSIFAYTKVGSLTNWNFVAVGGVFSLGIQSNGSLWYSGNMLATANTVQHTDVFKLLD